MKLRKAIPRLRFERRRLYAQSKVCPPEMRREYRERAEAIGATFRALFSPRRRLTEKFISAIPATHAMYLIPAVPEKDSR